NTRKSRSGGEYRLRADSTNVAGGLHGDRFSAMQQRHSTNADRWIFRQQGSSIVAESRRAQFPEVDSGLQRTVRPVRLRNFQQQSRASVGWPKRLADQCQTYVVRAVFLHDL